MNWIRKTKNFYNQKQRSVAVYFFVLCFAIASFTVLSAWQSLTDDQVSADEVEAAAFSVTLNTPDASTDLVATTGSITAGSTLGYSWTYEGNPLMRVNYPFDDGATVKDISGSSNNGTITGPSFTTSGCQVGGCFDFGGVSDRITASLGTLNAPYTVSTWVYFDNLNQGALDYDYLYSIGNGGAETTLGVARRADDGNGDKLYVYEGTTSLYGPVLTGQAWTHIVMVVNSSAPYLTLYRNGVQEAITDNNTTINTNGNLYLGYLGTSNTHYLTGKLDEFQIYKRALTAEQVTQIYTDQNSNIGGPTEIVQEEHADEDLWGLSVYEITSAGVIDSSGTFVGSRVIGSTTPVLDSGDFSFNSPNEGTNVDPNFTAPGGFTGSLGYQWLVDGSPYTNLNMPFNSGSTQRDVSGNLLNSALNTTTFTTTGCKVGGCISLDGAADYVGDIGSTSTFSFIQNTGVFSISAWIKLDNPDIDSKGQTIFSNTPTGSEKGLYFAYTDYTAASANNEFRILILGGSGAIIDSRSADDAVTDTNWHHVVVTGDATNVFFYVDGVKETGSGTMGTKATGNSSRSANIGRYPYSTPGSYFDGMIDEVMVFDHQLSDAQVTQIYNDTNGGNAGPTEIVPAEHAFNQTWRLDVFEFNSSGLATQEFTAGSATIAAAAVTTLDITQPSGTQSEDTTITFTCSNADDEARDVLVEYSEDGGSGYSSATISSPSSGTVSGSQIQGVTCDGTNQTFTWNSTSDVEGSQSDIRIRLTAQINAAPSGATTNFSIANPLNICNATGEASDDKLTSAETSFDNSGIIIDGCTFTIDGSHTFTSLLIQNSGVLNHSDTTTSTAYSVDLTITGNVTIESGSSITLDSRGYKGGPTGQAGYTTGNSQTNGATGQLGGSYGGRGGYESTGEGVTYGDPANPTEPGAGGSGTSITGKDGGGLVRITAGGTMTINGTISANGGDASDGCCSNLQSGAGAGGGIYLNADTFAGTGTIRANGGYGRYGSGGYRHGAGGGGRIAIISSTNTFSGTVTAYGGSADNAVLYAAAGTVYYEDTDTQTSGQGDLYVKNQVSVARVTPIAASEVFDNIIIQDMGRVEAGTFTVTDTLTIESGGILQHGDTTSSTTYSLAITTANIDVQSGGSITIDGLGYKGGPTGQAGYTTGNSQTNGATGQLGGSYGGRGGYESTGEGVTYGDPANPTEPGAGGSGTSITGKDGGGLVRITASGTVTVNGTISANGAAASAGSGSSQSGAGAGGGIYISAGTLAGSGTIRANGGYGEYGSGGYRHGAGGGGRIAILYSTNSFAGTVTAYGGSASNLILYAAAGTVYYEDTDTQTSGQGDLYVGNQVSTDRVTPLADSEVFDNIIIQDMGRVEAGTFTVNDTLTILNGGILQHADTTSSTVYSLAITAANVDVQSGGTVSGNYLGYKGGPTGQAGYTTGNSQTNGATGQLGGSHGGRGGYETGSDGVTYGNPLNPTEPGAGGSGTSITGKDGGGLVRITASGTVTVDGTITMNGEDADAGSTSSSSGAGAGGGIYISAGTLAGSGTIRANGGYGEYGSGGYRHGAGGGGRVVLIYTTKTFSGSAQAYGGSASNSVLYAAAGTIYESGSSTTFTVDNNGTNAAVQTPLCYTGGATSYSFADVVVQDYGELLIDSPCTCSPNSLTVTGTLTIQTNGSITDNLACTSGPPAPNITTTSLPVAPINTAYSQTVSGSGGYKPYTWSIASGSLPTGLSLNSSTGVISGTPTVSESQTFTVRLTEDSSGGSTTDDQSLTITVNSTPTAPTSLYTGNGSAQSGESNPATINDPYFSAVFNDPDTWGDTATTYRLQVYSDANATSLVWDSGATALSSSCARGTRCADIQYGGSEGSIIVGNTYYWRILFVDANGVSSPYSESAPLSNTFTYVSSGTSQTVTEARQTPNNPLALAPTIIDPNTIEIEWIDRSTNEAGFRILNEYNEVIKEVAANTTKTTLENIPSNTSVSGIKVVAYNTNGQSSPSQSYVEVVMPAPVVIPTVISETETTVTLGISQLMNNLTEGQSGIEIEIQTEEGVQTSGWITTQSHTFEVDPSAGIEVRVRTRNQEGKETSWSEWYVIDQLELGGLLLRFDVSSIGSAGVTASALRQFDLDAKMKGLIRISNNNEINVNNLFVNMVMPSNVKYIPGTLVVNGVSQTDIADQDYGQANSNAISMIVGELNGFTGMRLEFEFAFADIYKDTFRARRIENTLTQIESGELVLDGTTTDTKETILRLESRLQQLQSTRAQAISDDEVVALTVTASADDQDQVEITQQIAADEEAVQEEVIQEAQEEGGSTPQQEEQQTTEEEVSNEPPSQEEETEIQETIEEILEVIANPSEPQNPPAPPSTIQTPSESGQTPSGQEVGRPGIDSPGTNTSHGNGTFNVKTIGANGEKLSVSGSAIVNGSEIKFSGTASEPFSVVTVILNNNTTVIAVADRLGNWSTNVTAEQLGLQVGEEQTYEIELIAAKGDLRTDRVNIGRVKLLLKAIDELEAEFERLAKESTLETVLENIRMDVVEYIEKNEPEIQSTLGVTVPIVIASSAPLWGYIPMLPTLLYHALTYLIGYIGRKKKKQRYYGVIYDAITKDPLSLVVIRIYDSATKKLAATTVSNKFGHYEVLLKDGNYYLEARKPQFVFPSHIVTSQTDGEYDHVYQSTGFTFSTAVPSLPDVPMDPLNYNAIWNKARLMKLWYSVQRAGKFLAVPVLLAGSLASILLLAVSPLSTTNWILAVFYVAILFLQLRLRLVTKPAWGVVSDQQTNVALPLLSLQLIETEQDKVVKSRLTDYEGRYYFTPEPGQYQIKASKEGYQDTQVDIKVKKKDERVAKDIDMQK